MNTLFIDGQEGTTGLLIFERLQGRNDIEIIEIPLEKRKDRQTRTTLLNEANIVILCLPDDAAREAVALIRNPDTKVIDASTAHRVSQGWVYGLPELSPTQREKIITSHRISNPGCYPTGVILAIYPLIVRGLLPADYPITIHAVSGYSGGGKKLIHRYEDQEMIDPESFSYRPYALDLKQKHVTEMQRWSGLKYPPVFMPSVGNFYKGMLISIPLIAGLLGKRATPRDIHHLLSEYYAAEKFVTVMPTDTDSYLDNGFLSPTGCNDTNGVDLFVLGNEDQILLLARLDNLGKGSSGAAVQNLNLMLNIEEEKGLT